MAIVINHLAEGSGFWDYFSLEFFFFGCGHNVGDANELFIYQLFSR